MAKQAIPHPIIDGLEQLKCKTFYRGNIQNQIDFEYALGFLMQYDGNKATFESYRREAERLLQWTWLIKETSIINLKRQDIEEYIGFCLKPPLSWIGIKKTPRFIVPNGERIPNPEWCPFVATVSKHDHKKGIKPDKKLYQLSQKAIQEIFTVLSSFYTYLLLEEKVTSNPIALIKQKSKYLQKRQSRSTVMRLTESQWDTCLQTAKEMAALEPDKHERTLFILSLLYLLYLRISELTESTRWSPQMGHFYQDSNGHWWFKTIGKGNKMRDIAVSDDMLIALRRYRESLKLSPLPFPREQTPLLQKEKGRGSMSSPRHIRTIIQLCFDNTIQKLKENGDIQEADSLEVATVHWLRHTGISDDINKRGRPVAHVRDDAGHSSSAITDRYNDIELKERYQSAKKKKLKEEFTNSKS